MQKEILRIVPVLSHLMIACLATLGACLSALAGESKVDLDVVHRIKAEAFESTQVMNYLFQLTDVNGPRLTGSPGFRAAAEWAVNHLRNCGLKNPRLESWSDFGRGWEYSSFEIHMTKPVFAPLHGAPLAWCEGTRGPAHGEVVAAPFLHEEDEARSLDIEEVADRIKEYRERWQGKLRGKIVLLGHAREFDPATEGPVHRLDSKDLTAMVEAPEPGPAPKIEWPITKLPKNAKKRSLLFQHLPMEIRLDYSRRLRAAFDGLIAFLREEGVVATLQVDKRGAGGIVFAEAAGRAAPEAPVPPASVKLEPEQYNRLYRLVERGQAVEVELDLTANLIESPLVVNVVAEIPGDKKPDEVVMLGAHLDSWHSGTGATDNAAGCAVVLEAVRILKALGLKMDRTVRLALWSGEEQGLLGSRAYVRDHFADPVTMALKPEHGKLCAYFNLDNGGGKIRGIHLQGNDMVRPIFESWLAPFKDLGVTTITIRDTGGTDHLSFDAVGLPGFQFIQDPLDYGTRTHHSELDVYDHVQAGDLMEASAVMAAFVYQAATQQEMLPRKPLPKPLPPKTSGPAKSGN